MLVGKQNEGDEKDDDQDDEVMLRGDEVEYTKDLSPYGSPHVVEDELQYVSYKDYGAKFKPYKPVTVGATVVASDDNVLWVAKVAKMKRRPRTKGMSCWITLADGHTKIMKANKLTGSTTLILTLIHPSSHSTSP